MKTFLIVYKKQTPEAKKKSHELSLWLQERKHKVFSSHSQSIHKSIPRWPKNKKLSRIDLVIVIGGDGTYLEAVHLVNGSKIPILGINLGSLGFLTETKLEDMNKAIEHFIQGKLEERPRSMLEVRVTNPRKTFQFVALNDIVIERGASTHLMHMQVQANKQIVSDLKADGLILSSPSGSTAYNLAAGGPILHPEVSAFVMTPICPHSLTSRPFLFPDDYTLHIQLLDKRQKASLIIDGDTSLTLTSRSLVEIKKSKMVHYVLREPNHNFYYLLRKKLKFGER